MIKNDGANRVIEWFTAEGLKLTSKSPMVNRVAASESDGGKSGLITYIFICGACIKHKQSKKMNILLETNCLSIVSKWSVFVSELVIGTQSTNNTDEFFYDFVYSFTQLVESFKI